RWVLFLNPDTELLEGSLGGLLEELDRRPQVGIAGVRQLDANGVLTPTMRRFPSTTRALGDALGLERLPQRPAWLGERELRLGGGFPGGASAAVRPRVAGRRAAGTACGTRRDGAGARAPPSSVRAPRRDVRGRLRRRLRGVRVEPARPQPGPPDPAEWTRLAARFAAGGPGVIGATGGSGTRVLARVVQRGGMYIGSDLNRSEDALDFAAFSDRWINRYAAGEEPSEMVAELRALVARQHLDAEGRPWGWKEPRSLYLLRFIDKQLPGLRFLHL